MVIGIAAMLTALLPAVGRDRKAADRMVCLAPLGYRRDPVPSEQFNSKTTGAFCRLGWRYDAGLFRQPRVLF